MLNRKLQYWLVLAALVCACSPNSASGPDVLHQVPLHGPAIDFSAPDLTGRQVSLRNFRGQWVLLNFWATWCSTCMEELPHLVRLAKNSKGGKLAVVTVSVDEDLNALKRVVDSSRAEFVTLSDPGGAIALRFGTSKFPESFLIDPKGNWVAKFVGPRDWTAPAFTQYFKELVN